MHLNIMSFMKFEDYAIFSDFFLLVVHTYSNSHTKIIHTVFVLCLTALDHFTSITFFIYFLIPEHFSTSLLFVSFDLVSFFLRGYFEFSRAIFNFYRSFIVNFKPRNLWCLYLFLKILHHFVISCKIVEYR